MMRGRHVVFGRPQRAGHHGPPVDMVDRTRRLFEVDFRNVTSIAKTSSASRRAWPVLAGCSTGGRRLAADALGGAEQVLDMAVAYAKTREQFGRRSARFKR